MATTVVDALANMIREELAPAIREQEIPLDGLFQKIKTSSMNVTSAGIGRGYLVKPTFITGLAGGFKYVSASGAAGGVLTGSAASPMYQTRVWGTQQAFPTKAESPAPALFQQTVGLTKAYGNMFLPLDILKANQLDAAIGDYVSKTIVAAAKKVALVNAASFFSPADNRLHTITAISNSNRATGKITYTIGTTTGGRIREAHPGVAVDIYDATLATLRNPSTILIMDSIDLLSGTINIVSPTGADLSSLGIVNTDVVFFKDSYATARLAPYGLQDWIKDSGTLFHAGSGIDIAQYPQFKSLIHGVNGALTDAVLDQDISKFRDAYGADLVDTIITTRGVTTKFMQQPLIATGNMVWQRQGQPVDYVGGFAKIGYIYEGRELGWNASAFCPLGNLFIIKVAGNLTRYIPPALPKAGSDKNFPGEIDFVGPALGYNSIFMAVTNDDGSASPEVQAPFETYEQRLPNDPRSIQMTGLTEAYVGY